MPVPDRHGDGWPLDVENVDMDMNGRWISLKQRCNLVLDYSGKPTVSYQENYEIYRHVLHSISDRRRMAEYGSRRRAIA